MAVHQLHAQLVIPNTNAIASDIAVNNWSFLWDDVLQGSSGLGANIRARLAAFYNGIVTHMSGVANTAGATLKLYDRGDTAPRVPIYTSTAVGISAASGGPLPSEVALCLSFKGAVSSGIVQARRRGRVYLGPFNSTNLTNLHSDGAPSTTITGAVRTAAAALLASNTSDPGVLWGIRSDMDDLTVPVISGWVDNAWDTQRRRGTKANARVTF